jgi:hypothetical protein
MHSKKPYQGSTKEEKLGSNPGEQVIAKVDEGEEAIR